MFDLSDLYQQLILDHNRSPRNRRHLESPDRSAEGYNPLCGDRVRIQVKVRDGVIEDVAFEGSGCAISTASASMLTEQVKGRTVEEAVELFKRFHDLLAGAEAGNGSNLGKLEAFAGVRRYPARVKCATLAWHTLKAALDDRKDLVTTE
jgi:nitrogen fixation NifU-like protein